jgi:8-oxo-dGTP diphosphatase
VIQITGIQEQHVVTCFLQSEGKILLLRRSEQVGTYRGRWAGVSGYLEDNPEDQAYTEISEETDLGRNDVKLLKKGTPYTIEDDELGIRWIVHPFLFQVKDRSKVKIDWEHKEYRWIAPEEMGGYDTVPGLKEVFYSVYEN